MNYLGHFYLSQLRPSLVIGNLLGDYIHGNNDILSFPIEIQQGIRMHRYIDSFTDTNSSIKDMQTFFKPYFGRYASVINDVVIDYFLARDPEFFNDKMPLETYANHVYKILQDNQDLFNTNGQNLIHHMTEDNWLTQYGQNYGISKSLNYVIHRAKYINTDKSAKDVIQIIETHNDVLQKLYKNYIYQIIDATQKEFF